MAMNIEVYNSVFAKNDRKEFPLDCLNSKPPRIKTTRVFKSSKQAPEVKKKQENLFYDWVRYCLGRCTRFGQGRGIQCSCPPLIATN